MAVTEHSYTKLAGSSLRRAPFGLTRTRLWLGQDHLLAVNHTVATEEYHRFYFRDVEAFVVRRTTNRETWNWIFAIFALLTAVPFFIAWRSQGSGGFFAAAMGGAIFWGVLILANSLRGATCQTHIRTAVQLVALPSLNRISVTRRALARLQPLILAAQGEATPEELASAPWMAAETSKATDAPKPLRADKGILHGTLLGLLLAEAAATAGYFAVAHEPLSAVSLLLMLAGFIVSICALLRETGSDISEGVRTVTKCAIGYYVLKCLAGFAFTIAYVVHHQGAQVVTGLEMVDEPGFAEASMVSAALAAILGLIGIIVLLGHLRRRRAGVAAVNRMAAVLAQRCLHHPLREAVARCPECGQSYCRECVTEHEDRVVCSSCLRKLTVTAEKKRRNFAPVWRTTATVTGLVIAWIFFFLVGRMLVNTPSKFHEGTLWMTELEDAVEGDQ